MESAARVLVIDDTLLIREMARKLLEASGYDVRCVESGAEARGVWGSWRPDVVLLDLVMPEECGWDVLVSLREQLGSTVAVFMFSGDDDVTEANARERGAEGFIRKPFAAGELLSRLKSATSNPDRPGSDS